MAENPERETEADPAHCAEPGCTYRALPGTEHCTRHGQVGRCSSCGTLTPPTWTRPCPECGGWVQIPDHVAQHLFNRPRHRR
jgi:hypothetical protein